MSNLKELIKELQEARVYEILAVSTTTKLEKLEIINDEKLFPYASFIQHEFGKIEDYFKAKHKQDYYIFDSIFSPSTDLINKYFHKNEHISYPNALCLFAQNYCDYYHIKGLETHNPQMLILSERYSGIEVFLNFNEITDIVYSYCIENKIIGYRNDW